MGQFRKSALVTVRSALPPTADILTWPSHVRFVPIPEVAVASFDHLVGADEYRGQHGETDRFGRPKINDQIELRARFEIGCQACRPSNSTLASFKWL
jgi:hypothetical protein